LKWKSKLGKLLLLSVLILAFNVRQVGSLYPPLTEWTRTYGIDGNSDYLYCLILTDDGGYAMLGDTIMMMGSLHTSDFLLVKTDPAGNVEWNKTYGVPGWPEIGGIEHGRSIVQTDDGGYILAGHNCTELPDWEFDIWLVKTDSTGNMQWNQTYGGVDFDGTMCVIQTNDGGYAIAGFTRSFGAGNYDFWLVKVDSAGNMQWNQTYGGAGYDMAYSAIQTSDGGYAIAGFTDSYGAGGYDFWLVKTDSTGNLQWNQTYGGASADRALSMMPTSDGGYAIAGTTSSFGAGDSDFWLVKTDSLGTMEWNHTYGGMQAETASSLVQARDGGYALLGDTNSFGAGGYDYWLVKTDSSGNMQWNQTYGGSLTDFGSTVVQTVDGGYAMAGYSNYYVTPSYAENDFWLVKVCVGDVNGDGSINVIDLTLVSFAYGSFEGEPDYNPDADLNDDGIVDMKDIFTVARNLGKPS
jgi:predicted secreted protein